MKKTLSFIADASFVLILISFLTLQSFMVQNTDIEKSQNTIENVNKITKAKK